MSDNILEEVIANILLRLRLKDIVSCRSVSKQWLSIIDHPQFISRQLQRSISKNSNAALFLQDRRREDGEMIAYGFGYDESLEDYKVVRIQTKDDSDNCYYHAEVNGVRSKDFFRTIPLPYAGWMHYGRKSIGVFVDGVTCIVPTRMNM
ncbi:hypothetical protein LINPERHAP2_LOCUS39420 [Linum perenne]